MKNSQISTDDAGASSRAAHGSALPTMPKEQARRHALRLKDKWESIVTDAFRYGYLTPELCAGCGKYQCGGCPCGTATGWMPGLDAPNDSSSATPGGKHG